jgi:ADP-ribose pyrophosphatase YjhB (NUDIX family)
MPTEKTPKQPSFDPIGKFSEQINERFKKYFTRRKPSIQEVVREPTSGGIVFRRNAQSNDVEILLIQDAKDRWTIPKGHIEEGETAKETAGREIGEETGLQDVDVMSWLGKIHFRYRRQQSLVLMTTQIYLVRARGDTNALKKEEWMNGIGWFNVHDALDMIEYEDIGKLILLAMKKIRDAGL